MTLTAAPPSSSGAIDDPEDDPEAAAAAASSSAPPAARSTQCGCTVPFAGASGSFHTKRCRGGVHRRRLELKGAEGGH